MMKEVLFTLVFTGVVLLSANYSWAQGVNPDVVGTDAVAGFDLSQPINPDVVGTDTVSQLNFPSPGQGIPVNPGNPVVPEPASMILLGSSLLGAMMLRKRKND